MIFISITEKIQLHMGHSPETSSLPQLPNHVYDLASRPLYQNPPESGFISISDGGLEIRVLVHDNLVVNIGGHNASLTDSLLTLPSWRDCRSIVQR